MVKGSFGPVKSFGMRLVLMKIVFDLTGTRKLKANLKPRLDTMKAPLLIHKLEIRAAPPGRIGFWP